MAFTQYAAKMDRTFMAVKLAMAPGNCGAAIATRAQPRNYSTNILLSSDRRSR